jgi:hypothetical protein
MRHGAFRNLRWTLEKLALDSSLGRKISALTNTCTTTDAFTKVVQLGSTNVTATGDLDLLNLG